MLCCTIFWLAKLRWRKQVLEDERKYFEGNEDILRDGPPIYTSKDYLSILTVNLGNFIRGRKKTVPEKFARMIVPSCSLHVFFGTHVSLRQVSVGEWRRTFIKVKAFRPGGGAG